MTFHSWKAALVWSWLRDCRATMATFRWTNWYDLRSKAKKREQAVKSFVKVRSQSVVVSKIWSPVILSDSRSTVASTTVTVSMWHHCMKMCQCHCVPLICIWNRYPFMIAFASVDIQHNMHDLTRPGPVCSWHDVRCSTFLSLHKYRHVPSSKFDFLSCRGHK